PQRVSNKLNAICKKHSLKVISTHGFRHTHCTLLFQIPGMTPKKVQERMGHSSIQTTLNIYTHVTDGDNRDTVTKFAQYVSL
ncbi:MAG: tyrosine-type recombinase/integrase, partial [Clostridium sp.]|nr:tyrosine-type recombinase/integrase [Clostridium sp.]